VCLKHELCIQGLSKPGCQVIECDASHQWSEPLNCTFDISAAVKSTTDNIMIGMYSANRC